MHGMKGIFTAARNYTCPLLNMSFSIFMHPGEISLKKRHALYKISHGLYTLYPADIIVIDHYFLSLILYVLIYWSNLHCLSVHN